MRINNIDQKIFKYLMTDKNNNDNDNVLLSNAGLYNIIEILKRATNGATKKQLCNLFPDTDFNIISIKNDIVGKNGEVVGQSSDVSTLNWMVVKTFIDNIKYKPEFVSSLMHSTKLSLIEKDTNIDELAKDINRYISKNTNGQIKNIASSQLYKEPNFISEIGNIVHFSGNWQAAKWDPLGIEEHVFKNINGKNVRVPFICSWADYIENDTIFGFSMNYMDKENLGRYRFVCLLPKDEKSDINDISLDDIEYYKGSYSLEVKLPKFKFECNNDFKDILINNGVTDIFTESSDFSGAFDIIGKENYVCASTIKQKAIIDVNEYGTEASAVTYVPMLYGTGADFRDKKLIEIIVNRPFIFMIYDFKLDIPIFTGCIKNIDGEFDLKNEKYEETYKEQIIKLGDILNERKC